MRVVADLAGAPFIGFVGMHIMEVEHAVPEVRFRIGALAIGQCIAVAAKTEGKV